MTPNRLFRAATAQSITILGAEFSAFNLSCIINSTSVAAALQGGRVVCTVPALAVSGYYRVGVQNDALDIHWAPTLLHIFGTLSELMQYCSYYC